MDRLDALQLFTRIVELGNFSRAADALDIPRATASHAIKDLEARLGTRLLERTTRHVRPTADGRAYYERCLHVLGELEDAEASLRQVAANPRGPLRVDLHGTHAARVVLPHIDDFHQRYPHVELVIGSGDRLVDLVREGVDCVIRGGNPRDDSLVARPLATMEQLICASPAYLAGFGTPTDPRDLASHQVVRYFHGNGAPDSTLDLLVDGKSRSYTLGGWLAVNDTDNYVAAALSGAGLIQLPRFRVSEELAAGGLVEVLADWPSPSLPLTALYPHRRHLSPRVRVFIDWVADLYQRRFGPHR